MDFRLTCDGPLRAASNSRSKRPKDKHEIRRVFHRQLKRLWQIHPYLKQAHVTHRREGTVPPFTPLIDHLSREYTRNGYNFVPLVTESLSLVCSLDILFIRNSIPGEIINNVAI